MKCGSVQLARGTLQRILAGRRGGDSLYTAERLAKALDLPLGTVVTALQTSVTEAQEWRRLVRAALLAPLEEELRR